MAHLFKIDRSTQETSDIEEIRQWASDRRGSPAIIRRGSEETRILQFKFDDDEDHLKPISWKEFRDIFEENQLKFVYQRDDSNGERSHQFKFVARENRKRSEGTHG